MYFSAPRAPRDENILYLDGVDAGGIVNNCCFPSTVAPSYAPPGRALVSASTIGTHDGLSDSALVEVRPASASVSFVADVPDLSHQKLGMLNIQTSYLSGAK